MAAYTLELAAYTSELTAYTLKLAAYTPELAAYTFENKGLTWLRRPCRLGGTGSAGGWPGAAPAAWKEGTENKKREDRKKKKRIRP